MTQHILVPALGPVMTSTSQISAIAPADASALDAAASRIQAATRESLADTSADGLILVPALPPVMTPAASAPAAETDLDAAAAVIQAAAGGGGADDLDAAAAVIQAAAGGGGAADLDAAAAVIQRAAGGGEASADAGADAAAAGALAAAAVPPPAAAAPGAPAQSLYEGERKSGRMEGKGCYRFTSGTVFTGAFLDGEFHGDGILEFPGCGRYIATWERGKVVKGNYVFADGLGYDDTTGGPWSYCAEGGDRRFYSEVVNGLRPAGDAQLANAHPPPKIPAGSYDVGHGYFVEGEGKVYAYSGAEVRTADAREAAWAVAKCRKG